jgi:type I restriction enzyme, S subunit
MRKQRTDAESQFMPEKSLNELFDQSHDRGRVGLPVMSLSMGRGLVPRNQDERRVETNLSDEQHRLVRAGELAYNMMRMWQGVCSLAEEDCLVSPAYVVVRPLKGMDSKFSEYLLTYEETVTKFKRLSFGVVDDRLRLYFKDFERVRVRIPSHPAQRKIARILKTVDNLIEKTESLIAKYQAIKQGMMHDLFTRGVDAHGHLRPPQTEAPDLYKQSELGWIPKEWDINQVGDYLDCIEQGWSPDCDSEPASAGEWGVLKTTAVVWDGFECRENKRLPSRLPPIPQYEVHVDDVLMTRGGPNSRVGVVAIVRVTRDKLMLSDKLYRLIPKKNLQPGYLALALSSARTQTHLSTLKTGLAESQTNISQQIVRRLWIGVPAPEEQRRTCERIDAIEKVLHTQRRSLSEFRVLKTGLMQDLLTGKVRVKVDEAEEVAHA